MSVIDKSTNVGLNYLLIVRFGWASAGAGWATAISQYLNLLVGLILVMQELQFFSWQGFTDKILEQILLATNFLVSIVISPSVLWH